MVSGSDIQQSDSVVTHTRICILLFQILSIVSYLKILNIVPCALQQTLFYI